MSGTQTKALTAKAVKILQDTYSKDFNANTFQIYVEVLKDIPPQILGAAVMKLIRTCKFCPKPAEIIEAAESIRDEVNQTGKAVELTAEEAWEKVYSAAEHQGYDYGLQTLDGVVAQTAKTIWRDLCYCRIGSDIPILRSHFIKSYTLNIESSKDKVHTLNAINAVPALKDAREQNIQRLVSEVAKAKQIVSGDE